MGDKRQLDARRSYATRSRLHFTSATWLLRMRLCRRQLPGLPCEWSRLERRPMRERRNVLQKRTQRVRLEKLQAAV